jgi:hypothetical protein
MATYLFAREEEKTRSVPHRLGIANQEFRLVFRRTRINFDPDKEETNIRRHRYCLKALCISLERIIMPEGAKVPHMISDAFEEKGEVRHKRRRLRRCGVHGDNHAG